MDQRLPVSDGGGWGLAAAQRLDECAPGREHQIGGDGAQVFEEALAGADGVRASVQAASARPATVCMADATRFMVASTAAGLASPCPKVCSKL